MEFNVAQLLKENVGASRLYEIDEKDVEIPSVSPSTAVRGTVLLTRVPEGVLVTAKLDTTALIVCSRCLTETIEPLHLEFEEEFFQVVDVLSGRPLRHEFELGPEAPRISEQHVLDLRDVFRQEAIVAQRMHSLCSPECLGLCGQCGANLNIDACGCEAPPAESPFAVLRSLHLN